MIIMDFLWRETLLISFTLLINSIPFLFTLHWPKTKRFSSIHFHNGSTRAMYWNPLLILFQVAFEGKVSIVFMIIQFNVHSNKTQTKTKVSLIVITVSTEVVSL